ncbi:MAG: alpha-isopropylmalate synthase regulatory domain-containing protein [Pirellulaceae bacterium]
MQIAFSQVVQKVTDATGQEMSARDVAAKFVETYMKPTETLIYHSHAPVDCDTEDQERHRFTVSYQGDKQEITGQGAGPLDAMVNALTERFGLAVDIQDYHEHAMEAGSDSSAAAYVLVKTADGQELFGVGQHKSITKASILGLVAAINRSLLPERGWLGSEDDEEGLEVARVGARARYKTDSPTRQARRGLRITARQDRWGLRITARQAQG